MFHDLSVAYGKIIVSSQKNTTIKQLATFAAERTPRQLAISTTSLVDIFFFSLWQPT